MALFLHFGALCHTRRTPRECPRGQQQIWEQIVEDGSDGDEPNSLLDLPECS